MLLTLSSDFFELFLAPTVFFRPSIKHLYNSSRFCILYFILGRPSKGEYSGLSNAEKCKLYRSKGSEQKKKKDALREKLWRGKLKTNGVEYDQYKVNERYRKL